MKIGSGKNFKKKLGNVEKWCSKTPNNYLRMKLIKQKKTPSTESPSFKNRSK